MTQSEKGKTVHPLPYAYLMRYIHILKKTFSVYII